MDMNACLAIVLGCLSVAKAQDTFCSRGFCFIRPDPNSGKTWSVAQQMCKDNNSTLPIANDTNSRMSVIEALDHFQLHGSDAWLGATAFDNGPDIWRWLNGSQYNGTDVQGRGEFYKSYAYVAKATILSEVNAYASPPNASYSYICQCKATNTEICTYGTGRTAFVMESQCFMRYDEKLSWFNARNKCLENSCDLASFSQLSILDGMVDSSSGGFWVGLRTSQWNWQNAVTGLSSDVTFTSWSFGQPNDAAPGCMATNSGDFPNWKDISCANVFPYICQVLDKSPSSAAPNPSTTMPSPPTSFSSTPTSTSTTKSLGTPGTGSTSASLSTTPSSNTTEPSSLASNNDNNRNSTNAGSVTVNVPLAIGLGVGLGALFIIIVVVVIVVVAVVIRRKRRNSAVSGNAKSTKKFVTNTSDENTDNGTTERSENKKKGKTQQDESVDQYATVTSTFYPDAKFDSPANPGTVYADLRFNPDDP